VGQPLLRRLSLLWFTALDNPRIALSPFCSTAFKRLTGQIWNQWNHFFCNLKKLPKFWG
jgi:hypothetical protein